MSTPAQRTAAVVPEPSGAGGEARLRIDLATPVFTDSVLSDLDGIRRTAAGRALFRRLRDLGRTVTIEKPDPPTDPPNAWTLPRDHGSGRSAEIVIVYDPANWPNPAWPGCPPSDVVLFGRLLDAAALAAGGKPAAEPEPADATALDAYLRERETVPHRLSRTQR